MGARRKCHDCAPIFLRVGCWQASFVVAATVALGAAAATAQERVLVFTRAEGFVHPSITDGVTLVQSLGAQGGFGVETTGDAAAIETTNLARFDVVVFMSTTGDLLDAAEEAALRGWVEAGGGWVGVHAAADAEYDWSWYGTLLGGDAWFASHPAIQDATLIAEGGDAPPVACFPASFALRDEWYNFQANPRPVVEVMLTLDETSYDPGAGAMGADHPIAWRHTVGAGRAFYTGLGHRPETYADPGFREHLRGAFAWAAGADFADGFESGDLCRWSDAVASANTIPLAFEPAAVADRYP